MKDRDIISERIVDGFVYDPKVLAQAVLEIAEYLGHTMQSPIFPAVFSLSQYLTWEEHDKLLDIFFEIARNKDEDIDFMSVKKKLIKGVPALSSLNDSCVASLIKLYARIYVPELYHFAMTSLNEYEFKIEGK
ncbi:hypothetical protein B9N49_08920 [Finegoldia magna]|uniref:Uncharacterized protein n=1 Tax=Finegoldia magna TaxID=1260 RepID=A0A233V282_FINMA|nr:MULTISPECIES: hypothetical protein [Peptoniphilaceae]MDU5224289.1 hypothetical protein [Finegoldia magna]MDU5253359.1 hypothetical protein [Anaerococcus vaginalis]OXZ26517.1 hypothetical protein B9N49_08920 [Finegoldia magna]